MAIEDLPQDPNDREEINKPPWTMVVIRDSLPKTEFSVFPPINHENLHVSLHANHQIQGPFSPPPSSSSSSLASSPSSSSFSPSDSEQSDPDSPVAPESPVRKTGEAGWWWVGIRLEVLRSRILGFVASFGGNGIVWWKASYFASGAGIMAALLMLWSFYIRARRRRRVKNLMAIVREKDEKINQLLHQIAQLNEVLIARHKVLTSKLPN